MTHLFLFDLLRVRPRRGSRYRGLLERVGGREGGPYRIEASWQAYDELAPLLEEELRRWTGRRRVYRLLRYVAPPAVF
jgi:hypothetical protein